LGNVLIPFFHCPILHMSESEKEEEIPEEEVDEDTDVSSEEAKE
jgi:hypothetical protein